jgi:hypothetical protein
MGELTRDVSPLTENSSTDSESACMSATSSLAANSLTSLNAPLSQRNRSIIFADHLSAYVRDVHARRTSPHLAAKSPSLPASARSSANAAIFIAVKYAS